MIDSLMRGSRVRISIWPLDPDGTGGSTLTNPDERTMGAILHPNVRYEYSYGTRPNLTIERTDQ